MDGMASNFSTNDFRDKQRFSWFVSLAGSPGSPRRHLCTGDPLHWRYGSHLHTIAADPQRAGECSRPPGFARATLPKPEICRRSCVSGDNPSLPFGLSPDTRERLITGVFKTIRSKPANTPARPGAPDAGDSNQSQHPTPRQSGDFPNNRGKAFFTRKRSAAIYGVKLLITRHYATLQRRKAQKHINRITMSNRLSSPQRSLTPL